jgi:hypothetical protein
MAKVDSDFIVRQVNFVTSSNSYWAALNTVGTNLVNVATALDISIPINLMELATSNLAMIEASTDYLSRYQNIMNNDLPVTSGYIMYPTPSYTEASYTIMTATTDTNLWQSYDNVLDTLSLMSLSDDDEVNITGDVANSAAFIAKQLRDANLPPPEIVRHGPNSAVFSWGNEVHSLYVTVTTTRAYSLATDVKGVMARKVFPLDEPIVALSLINIPSLTSD